MIMTDSVYDDHRWSLGDGYYYEGNCILWEPWYEDYTEIEKNEDGEHEDIELLEF